MNEQTTFFSDMLGEYWGTPLRMRRSQKCGYTLCVYTGDEPDSEKGYVLHLNLKERTGLHDGGMHWRIYANESERVGHAWDDNMPDSASVEYPFEPWVRDRIGDMIRTLDRIGLRDAVLALEHKPPHTRDGWLELQSLFIKSEQRLDLQRRMAEPNIMDQRSGFLDTSEEEAWDVTLGQARCALELGDFQEVKRMAERFRDGYFEKGFTALTMVNSNVQSLLPPLILHDEDFWCSLMKAPMKKLASYKAGPPSYGESVQLRFFEWLCKAGNPRVMRLWVATLLKAKLRPGFLVGLSAMVNLESMADSALELLESGADLFGEQFNFLFTLRKVSRKAGNEARAEEANAKLTSMGFNEEIIGLYEEYLLLYHGITGRSSRTVAFERKDEISRLLELEDILNAHWLSRPEEELQANIRASHLLCGGTLLWIALWKCAEKPEKAFGRIRKFFSDWDRVRLLYASEPRSMEELIDSACVALLDSKGEQGSREAYALLNRVLAELPPTQNPRANYDYACIFARCGDVEQAVKQLGPFISDPDTKDISRSFSRIRHDPDFDGIRKDPRFVALMAKRTRKG